jgi:hypothetical protein
MHAQRGTGDISPLILNFGARAPVPIVQEAGWVQESVCMSLEYRKSFTRQIRIRTVQHVASRYTDRRNPGS